MKKHRPFIPEDIRHANAHFLSFWGVLVLGTACVFAKRGLGATTVLDTLGQITVAAITLAVGVLYCFRGSIRKQTSAQVTQLPTPTVAKPLTDKEREDARFAQVVFFLNTPFQIIMSLCYTVGLLLNPSLGWNYKACLVIALNIVGYTSCRFFPLSIARLKREWNNPTSMTTNTAAAPLASTVAPATSGSATVITVTTAAPPPAIVTGRGQQTP